MSIRFCPPSPILSIDDTKYDTHTAAIIGALHSFEQSLNPAKFYNTRRMNDNKTYMGTQRTPTTWDDLQQSL